MKILESRNSHERIEAVDSRTGERKTQNMDLKTLNMMAAADVVNPKLVEISALWQHRDNLSKHPVQYAVTLYRRRKIILANMIYIFFFCLIQAIGQVGIFAHNSLVLNKGTVVISWWWIVFVGFMMPSIICLYLNRRQRYCFQSAKCFIKAITLLEKLTKKQIEYWPSEGECREAAINHLKERASDVKNMEELDAAFLARNPFKKYEKYAPEARATFGTDFDLLTKILPISQEKREYYAKA